MSSSSVMYAIVAAIKGVEQILGPNLAWQATNDEQKRFLAEQFNECRSEVERLEFIETLASLKAEEINAFLKERGFSIKLEPFKPHEFGVASVLDIGVEWAVEGKKYPIRHNDVEYPGVRMKEGFEVWTAGWHHSEPIAVIKTKGDDLVHLTAVQHAPNDGLELADLALQYHTAAVPLHGVYDGLRFPMVDLNHEVDISWLIGMQTSALGEGWEISQAKQQTKLRMNHKGARAQSAVAVGTIMITSLPVRLPDLVIDQPFLCWFSRPGLKKPTFVAYLTPEDWKEPADLTTA